MSAPAAVVNYRAYLKTDHWRELRKRILWRDDYRCSVCNSASFVNVHHRTYDRLGCERDTDLITLCWKCHELFHDRRTLAG